MKPIPPPPVHWPAKPKGTPGSAPALQRKAANAAVTAPPGLRVSGIAPPPTKFSPRPVQRQAAPSIRRVSAPAHVPPVPIRRTNAVVQPMACLRWLFSSCLASPTQYDQLEMDDVDNTLPDWGLATRVGYHWTAHWPEIQRTGFDPGGGVLGVGYYVCDHDYDWVPKVYPKLTVLLEVGYLGDISKWAVRSLALSEYSSLSQEEIANYDVLQTNRQDGIQNQKCLKLGGPGNIQKNNFRVRRVITK
jgi:hypothetical protein